MNVISRVWALFGVSLFALFTISCTGQKEGPIHGDLEVLLPWSDELGVVASRPVLLRGVEDLAKMRGQFGRFEVDSEWSTEGGLKGLDPKTRFVRDENGVFVPLDERSGRLASLYAHLDRLSFFEDQLGLGVLNVNPLRVALDVNAHTSEGRWVDNALYDQKLNALLFAPDRDTALPLSLNPGVIAHERFHALFSRITGRGSLHNATILPVPGPLNPTDPTTAEQRYQEVYWNALNEGMADLWGWLYSGDADFMKRSFPVRGESRRLRAQRLDEADIEYLSEDKLRAEISRRWGEWRDPEISIRRFSYEVSTQFARKAYAEITKTSGAVPDTRTRALIAGRIISVLKDLSGIRGSSEGEKLPELKVVIGNLASDPTGSDGAQKADD